MEIIDDPIMTGNSHPNSRGSSGDHSNSPTRTGESRKKPGHSDFSHQHIEVPTDLKKGMDAFQEWVMPADVMKAPEDLVWKVKTYLDWITSFIGVKSSARKIIDGLKKTDKASWKNFIENWSGLEYFRYSSPNDMSVTMLEKFIACHCLCVDVESTKIIASPMEQLMMEREPH